MIDPRQISIQDFGYALPEEKIALHPLPERDASKLLIYKDGVISEDIYRNIAEYLPQKSMLIFNNSKVINARLKFTKKTGGVIEIFCLEPYDVTKEYNSIMQTTSPVRWKCFIGGMSKWKSGSLEKKLKINNEDLIISVKCEIKLSDAYVVKFSWMPALYHFAEVIEAAGDIPLPPYIKRDAGIRDASRYQTIYARHEGSVAAPTAGLHFTKNILEDLSARKIEQEFITLHVSAGTFKPVKTSLMYDHEMHAEWIDVSANTIKNIISRIDQVIAVGTTSLRTIETLYWLGVKLIHNSDRTDLTLSQWEIYEAPLNDRHIPAKDALNTLLKWIGINNMNRIFTQTKLLITPGYSFKIVKALITNFHQPQSTLLLLIAAATDGNWKKIYNYALENDFRFLSYGDGNLIFINKDNQG